MNQAIKTEENDPLAKAIDEADKKNAINPEIPSEPVNSKIENSAKPVNSTEAVTKPQAPIKKKRIYNAKGELKLTPQQVLNYLSLFDDFYMLQSWGCTKFKLEFDKLRKDDRIIDVQESKDYLLARGHKV